LFLRLRCDLHECQCVVLHRVVSLIALPPMYPMCCILLHIAYVVLNFIAS
jgi:hypothetical protein